MINSSIFSNYVINSSNYIWSYFSSPVKGFCTPPELSEETDDSKGAEGTTFEDIEEGGMGEGEGIRDVTDQIDNEGQVGEPWWWWWWLLFPVVYYFH